VRIACRGVGVVWRGFVWLRPVVFVFLIFFKVCPWCGLDAAGSLK
jgi:hypothetical protein